MGVVEEPCAMSVGSLVVRVSNPPSRPFVYTHATVIMGSLREF